MVVNQGRQELLAIDPSERILLLSHCLRPSQTCPGKMARKGLVCPEGCTEACVLGRLRQTALDLGYKEVCIAAGGSMAVKFVREHNPRGIVAIACDKELAEGVEAVRGLTGAENNMPAFVLIPLRTDGCVDTEVDEGEAMKAITLGCPLGRQRWMADDPIPAL